MAAGGNGRLSELPNDLLRRILHFAPLKEAASTTALSRRWRRARPLLWLSSGALNIETGVETYCSSRRHHDARFFSGRDTLVSAAAGALDAAAVPVTRLTLTHRSRDGTVERYTTLVDTVLTHRAARRVEELRLVSRNPKDNYYGNRVRGLYTVTLDSLPSETLRVLELTNCKGLLYQRQTAAVVLPRLSSLRLRHSVQHLSTLQRIIDAAPALAAVRLESVLIDATDEEVKEATTCHRLRCPVATVLVLDSCMWEEKNQDRGLGPNGFHYKETVNVDDVEINAPRLHRFRYKGLLGSFSFSSWLPELEQVDLEFLKHGYKVNNKDPKPDLEPETFWRFARNFTNEKEMRLRVNHVEDIAVLSEAKRVELLSAFRRLERLEFQGVHWTKGKTAAVMTILNLLRCYPVICALRINLAAEPEDASNKEGVPTRISQKEIQIVGLLGPRSFHCLKSSLRRVCLQFRLEKSDCLGVKLIKFFAENAMVLKEMHIDGGDENLCELMNPKTQKWNSKRRKLGATSLWSYLSTPDSTKNRKLNTDVPI